MFMVAYSGLGSGQYYQLKGRLYNPDSDFEQTDTQVIFSLNNMTSGVAVFKFETVATTASLGEGKGYVFEIAANYNSWLSTAVLSLTGIARTSLAIENGSGTPSVPQNKILVIDDSNKDQYIEYFTDRGTAEWGVWLSIPPEYSIVNVVSEDLIPDEFTASLVGISYGDRLRGIRPKGGDFQNYQRLIVAGSMSGMFWSSGEGSQLYRDAQGVMSKNWYAYKHGDIGSNNDAFSELMYMNGVWWSTYY